jgi:SAM-dependent methyltransferase
MTSVAPEAVVWDCLRGALVTRALALAAELRIADALADGPRPVDDLARESGADPDALHRILRALASDGVFAEVEPRVFRNTEPSELLRGRGYNDMARLFGGVWLETVRSFDAGGTSSFQALQGTDFWSWLRDHDHERALFDRAMEQGAESRLERLGSVEWRGDELVVDVGGGNGSLLLALLKRHPQMRGIVFDLPETVRDESAFGERCTFVAGSFFDEVPRGDAYILSTILHDWNDESAAAILRTVRTAAPDGARLVLLEAVVEEGNEPAGAKWLDLLMLALLDGRERDERQWRALLDATGFEPVRFGRGVIEARCR